MFSRVVHERVLGSEIVQNCFPTLEKAINMNVVQRKYETFMVVF